MGGGIAPTIMENHGKVLMVMEMKEYKAIDMRYDEGIRGRVENIQPTISAKSGGGVMYIFNNGKRN